MRSRRQLALLALIGAAITPVPAHADTPVRVADVDEVLPLRTWAGTTVTSVRDAAAGGYRLALLHTDGAIEPLPVAPRTVPFDADVGPGPDGAPVVVYSRCEREPDRAAAEARGCALQLLDLTRRVERRLAETDSPAASEMQPTIWRDRVAWVRIEDDAADTRPRVYTRSLRSAPATRSRRLPALPTCRRPEVGGARCAPTTGRVDELELYGRWLAQNQTYFYEGSGGLCGRREVRLTTLDGRVRKVADTVCGLAGQTHTGVSFQAGRLLWTRTCPGDDGGCTTTGGVWRYDLRSGAYALAPLSVRGAPGYPDLSAFAATSPTAALLGVDVPSRCPDLPEGDRSCGAVVRQDGLRFRPARPPRGGA